VTLLICGVVSSPIWSLGQVPQPVGDSAGLPLATQAPVAPQPTPVPARSYVYRVESSDAIADYEANSAVVRRMVDDLVMSATGESTVGAAWGSLVKPSDVVGIKVCTNGAPLFSTHPAVVNAIAAGLADAGVPRQNIVVWDRDQQLLKVAGYQTRSANYRLMWSEGNYDPKAVITSPISGKLIYGDLLFLAKTPDTLTGEAREDVDEKAKKKLRNTDNLSDESHLSTVLRQRFLRSFRRLIQHDNPEPR
jgi:hypothetical protein